MPRVHSPELHQALWPEVDLPFCKLAQAVNHSEPPLVSYFEGGLISLKNGWPFARLQGGSTSKLFKESGHRAFVGGHRLSAFAYIHCTLH